MYLTLLNKQTNLLRDAIFRILEREEKSQRRADYLTKIRGSPGRGGGVGDVALARPP